MPQRAPWVRDERARDRADPCPVTLPRGGNARSTQLALKRVITRDLGPVGPVFTLSDRNLQPNFLLTIVGYLSWVPLLLVGPLVAPPTCWRVFGQREGIWISSIISRQILLGRNELWDWQSSLQLTEHKRMVAIP